MSRGDSTLEFGVMCTGTTFDDWQAECIRHLLDVEGVRPKLLVLDDRRTTDRSRESRIGRVAERVRSAVETATSEGAKETVDRASWRLYNQHISDDGASRKPVDLSEELGGVERIACDVREEGYAEYFSESDLDRIREFDLDFVLRFAFGIIKGEILDVPRYGVWSFHHDDERKYRGVPPCFWEIYEGDPVTGAVLQRLTERLDGGIILRRGYFPTIPYSWTANLDQALYGTTKWPAQVAVDVLNGRTDYLEQSPSETDAPVYRSPRLSQMFRFGSKRAAAMVRELTRGYEKWSIGVSEAPVERFLDESKSATVQWYSSPRDTEFVADPFPAEIDGDTYVFFEKYSYEDETGNISYVRYDDGKRNDGKRNPTVETALERQYHLSYPYLFRHEGDLYATPETHEANEIALYRVASPDDWERERTLIPDVAGVDPTPVYHDDRWWLFFTKQDDMVNTNLHLWHAPTLTGEWRPHENNPVKTDVRAARPAGTPWTTDGDLYRPTQYCADWYGRKIVVNRVTELTSTGFAEEPVAEIAPSEDGPLSAGRHTISSGGGLTLVDGHRFVWNAYNVRRTADQIARNLRQ
ncbi:glucosamine inositolphosphorylceramide transferase family protein [Halorussus salinisoli]|uniref:glucosamine inositolphosphorylceramide transferase family protein n=1 Tax=Halorussus salinisoli TaxID=2558242 RepID=UPI0010C1B1E6|nr:hypothetical protein [Halorussus salinisoli]